MIDFKTDPNNNIKRSCKITVKVSVAEIEKSYKEKEVLVVS
jgi:hypothetical protein